MDAQDLWISLRNEQPDRVSRVAEKFEPVEGTALHLVEKLMDLRSLVSIANDKCGTIGNPYEQPTEDLEVLLSIARRLSGIRGRNKWERE